ncbi:hypothetical protein GEMRC1_007994 [Eukaryota sp. GEM-RC1]
MDVTVLLGSCNVPTTEYPLRLSLLLLPSTHLPISFTLQNSVTEGLLGVFSSIDSCLLSHVVLVIENCIRFRDLPVYVPFAIGSVAFSLESLDIPCFQDIQIENFSFRSL